MAFAQLREKRGASWLSILNEPQFEILSQEAANDRIDVGRNRIHASQK
ncbi:MAG: hypothetical protein WKF71_20985 [Pyrinomonadaceae bacterium]